MSAKKNNVAVRDAFTLVEVLAAVLIIGTAVTSLVVGQAQAMKQLHASELQLTSQHLARELIANWELEEVDLKSGESGIIEGQSSWSWQRTSHFPDDMPDGVHEIVLKLSWQGERTNNNIWTRSHRWLVSQNRTSLQ